MRKINYHLLSAAAEARTKREAPVFWKRNLAGGEVRDTHRPPPDAGEGGGGTMRVRTPGVCTATPPTMAAAARRRRRDAAEAHVYRRLISLRFQCERGCAAKRSRKRHTVGKFGLDLTYIACLKRPTQILCVLI